MEFELDLVFGPVDMVDAERNRSAGVGYSEQIMRGVVQSAPWYGCSSSTDMFGERSFIFAGYALALLLLSTGILYRAVHPGLGFILQFFGITIILLYFCGVVCAFLPKPFFVILALLLLPFFHALLIKPYRTQIDLYVIWMLFLFFLELLLNSCFFRFVKSMCNRLPTMSLSLFVKFCCRWRFKKFDSFFSSHCSFQSCKKFFCESEFKFLP